MLHQIRFKLVFITETLQVHKQRRARVTAPFCKGTCESPENRPDYGALSKICEKGKHFGSKITDCQKFNLKIRSYILCDRDYWCESCCWVPCAEL